MPLHEHDDPAADLFGPELSRTMNSTLSDLPVQTETLVSGAVTRGRRTRRRRRAVAWSTAGTALSALTAFAVVTALPGSHAGDTTATSVRIPDFTAVGAQASPPAGKEALTGAATVDILRDLLPGGPGPQPTVRWQNTDPRFTSVQTMGSITTRDKTVVDVRVMGDFVFSPAEAEAAPGNPPDADKAPPGTDSGGTVTPDKEAGKKDAARRSHESGIAKQRHDTSRTQLQHLYTCDVRSTTPLTDCHLSTLEGGATLLAYTTTTDGVRTRTADLLRPDGTRILVTATGTSLTEARLRTIAASPRWQQWVEPAVNDKAAGKTP
ncbi:hypothetical protein ACIREE_41705 [Streptomyces sp. NPDC102467]|uniref:hypothetical protein n=1 Tax=Streptomyces sp. NPDC102467 TaxID=3366179 RepID=UPI0038147400